MDANQYSSDVVSLRRSLKLSQWTNIGLVVLIGLALWNSVNLFGRDRTIVTPPKLEKSFWVTNSTADQNYVEEMAQWIASLELDVTPDNILYRTEHLLRYAHPSVHGHIKEERQLEINRIKRDNASSYFVTHLMNTDAKELATVLSGRLHVLINGKQVSEHARNYLVRFSMAGGKASVIDFKEVPHADIQKLLSDDVASH